MAESPCASSSDRELLFLVLAMRLGMISLAQFAAAAQAWSSKRGKPGEAAENRDLLTQAIRAELEPMVAAHIARRDGDIRQCLADLGAVPEIDQLLTQQSDRGAPTAIFQADNGAPPTAPPAQPPPAQSRFHILRPHARGGLGEVFVARDEELNREVALKEIQSQYASQTEHWSRFILEAEITGSLEHPGIVPVYGLGAYPDGRPYYAMRLIQGDSLQEAIRRFHEKDTAGRDPQERSLALRELLGRFVDVCQAIAFAHSRGVLHRDLKPGNVMLGKFGETLVVDWGLAKPLAASPGENRPPPATTGAPAPSGSDLMPTLAPSAPADTPATIARPLTWETGRTEPLAEQPVTPRTPHSRDMATQMGQAMGTPAYMSPEQAAGRLDQLGPASDVYSLGATLYHVLTGRPPFEEHDLTLLLKQVQHGEFPRPRAVKSSVPASLEAVCLRALALTPANRYAGAQELAAEVERWLADEPVRAYREPWTVRTRRWLGRHRVATTSAAVASVMAIASLAIVLFLTSANAARERELREHETEAKNLANQNLALAQAAQQQEILQQRLAQARLEKGVEAVERMVSRVTGEKWANRPELERERREVLEEAILFFKQLGSEGNHNPIVRRQAARAYLRCGNVQMTLGEYVGAGQSAHTALELYQGLVNEFPKDFPAREGLVDTRILLGGLDALRGRYSDALTDYSQARQIADEAVRLDPEGEGPLLCQADALVASARFFSISDPVRSQKLYAQALIDTEKLMSKPNPGYRTRLLAALCVANRGIGDVSQQGGTLAIPALIKARQILAPVEKMQAPDPQSAVVMSQTRASLDVAWGVYQSRLGKKEEGLAFVKQGIERLRSLRALMPDSFPFQYVTMQHLLTYGSELLRQDKGNEARAVFREIEQIRDKLLADLPQMTWLKSFGDSQKSELLIWQVQHGQGARAEAEMDALLKRSDNRSRQTLEYNSACLQARLSEKGPQADRERHASEAVKRLNALLATSFFERQNNRDHLDDDSDLAPIRPRPDFQDFVKRAKAKRPNSK